MAVTGTGDSHDREPGRARMAGGEFSDRVRRSLDDAVLQRNMGAASKRFVNGRARGMAELDNLEDIRTAAAAIRDRALADLDVYLEAFEREATARGAEVHWARTADEASRIVTGLAERYGVHKVVKSKSMVTEECGINDALAERGVEVLETDLGEYVLQLADEPPSHLVAPMVHKSREQVGELFSRFHGGTPTNDIPELTAQARDVLRPHFLSADMGISGANFLVAETGSTAIVTGEGNGRMVTTLPPVHVAVTGIEKVVPTLEDLDTLLRLLPRSSSGQPITSYVSLNTGVAGEEESDGPRHFHIVLVDAGRSALLGDTLQPALRCIRCGACMNHCPVYQSVGGHAYGWIYPGPIGSILTPAYAGLENAPDLPNASTLCNACGVVCPVRIPLPELMRELRTRQFEGGQRSRRERWLMAAWSWTARHPAAYGAVSGVAARVLAALGGAGRRIRRLPGLGGWTDGRDMPAPEGRTFRSQWAAGRRR
ncbi:LutB/LldF family L-lactate oxidation iron-sulfur protein [Arhodomonas aquaeolei]|uniref:LutB/LldF family L-lactate oxidation iron-sulfur protein n=1 Tax=Arhodomonas aquaeolei TaxID=2369 RepID=UPI002169A038|nr:LutB/LldF family L-lactate oxidation iron-sulfur protein [Arhodomonas aquaeolei]MCS4505873.1 LutB/LldF family L-lactate oxidation iron-sulfur protein [Arhodomonas aquaeolei]